MEENKIHLLATAPERNHAEAVIDVRYGIRFNDMTARLYKRLDSVFSLINMIGGSAAFATVAAGKPVFAGGLGIVIVLAAYIERELRPTEKSIRCEIQRQKFGDLASRAPDLTLAQIDRELMVLQSTGPDTIGSLALPAYNANVMSVGFPAYKQRLSVWERFVAWFA